MCPSIPSSGRAPARTFYTHPTTCPQTEQQLFSLGSSYFQGKNNHLLEQGRALVTGYTPDNPLPGAALTLCPVGAWSVELSLHKVSGELLVETSYTLLFQAHGRVVSCRLGARESEGSNPAAVLECRTEPTRPRQRSAPALQQQLRGGAAVKKGRNKILHLPSCLDTRTCVCVRMHT